MKNETSNTEESPFYPAGVPSDELHFGIDCLIQNFPPSWYLR
jgi:hypothetical protein